MATIILIRFVILCGGKRRGKESYLSHKSHEWFLHKVAKIRCQEIHPRNFARRFFGGVQVGSWQNIMRTTFNQVDCLYFTHNSLRVYEPR